MIGRGLGRLALTATVLLVAAWFVLLRPTILGGSTTYLLVSGRSMEPTIHAGSLVVLRRSAGYRAGEVVAYRIPGGDPASGLNVIHRIIGGSGEAGFILRGDNASASDLWRPHTDDVLGAPVLVVPGAMPVLLVLRSPIVIASLAAALSVYFTLGFWPPPRSTAKDRPGGEMPAHAVDAATWWS
jgi:signal peptidase I